MGFWGFGVLGFWGLGFWGFGVLGLGVLGFWGFGVWGQFGGLGVWGSRFSMLSPLGLNTLLFIDPVLSHITINIRLLLLSLLLFTKKYSLLSLVLSVILLYLLSDYYSCS